MTNHAHSTPTGRAHPDAGPSSLTSNRPCCPLCRTILTLLQPAVLTVMPDHPNFTPTGRLTVMPDLPHSLPTGRADGCRPILTPLPPAVLTDMPTAPHSLPTGRFVRYAGPFSLHTNRPCYQFCRPLLTPFQPAVLTTMPNHPHSTPVGCADSYTAPSLRSNRPW